MVIFGDIFLLREWSRIKIKLLFKDLGWSTDNQLLNQMKEDNKKTLTDLDEKIKDAEGIKISF